MPYAHSDTIAGYVTAFDAGRRAFTMTTSDGREFEVGLSTNCGARLINNLGEPYMDATGQLAKLLEKGRHLFVYGTFYPQGSGQVFEAQMIHVQGKKADQFRYEEPDWWINQAKNIADFFVRAQFGSEEDIDFRRYRTSIGLSGGKTGAVRQETDTISRLVYGFASTYLLTGEDKYLEGAEKGTQYLRDHMKFYDVDENVAYWYHGVDLTAEGRHHKVFASEFGDDYDAIPMYEQIYALAGPTQTYRISGDPDILKDIQLTIDLFDKFFIDREKGGYFSHLDPVTLDPRSESLGRNKGRKNWNSVGDHAPAFLINLWLATGERKYKDFLVYCADCIERYFPDYANSPFVNERFHEDWSHDLSWGWQQDRAVIGHNLKIAWNLMRIHSIEKKDAYVAFAKKIAELMPKVGMDKQRGGWYDVMDRKLQPGQDFHRFAWHDRKAWWQQEQGILAYQILYGILRDQEYLKLARESAGFYNTFFLDHEDGDVYFNVLSSGIPYLLGTERLKGSHSKSSYHSVELAYLAQVYTNLLHTGEPLTLHFKPFPNGFANNVLRVSPDILPPGSITIDSVTVDDKPYTAFDAANLTVEVPKVAHRPRVKVTLVPA